MEIASLYDQWIHNAIDDPDLKEELEAIRHQPEEIADRFYKELEFGTAGLRGVIGAGTNRMNVYTVRKATQGLADYVQALTPEGKVAIAFDSRNKSELFAREAACVLAANNIQVYLYAELTPTPMLSFAVRQLGCQAGIVITASHNPAQYNGYKAYGSDGCQLSVENSAKVLAYVDKVPMFGGAKTVAFHEAAARGRIVFVPDEVIQAYLDAVQRCSVRPVESDLRVVYTPLNGTGNRPVRAILKRIGCDHVTVVPSQESPDGNFPTCPYPNPEIRQAFEQAIALAESMQPKADLLLATDPDCDRVGIAVLHEGEYRLLTGNDVGAMLLDYILSGRKDNGTLPANPVAVKTIVTSPLADRVASKYGCQVINVLTGFKYIGEQIALLEAEGEENRFIFGFEESYGYLAGGYVRDKDAVVASMLICEMASFYKAQGKTLVDVVEALYREHGMILCTQRSYTCEGEAGMQRMNELMASLRALPPAKLGGKEVIAVLDYGQSVETNLETGEETPILLPRSEVLQYRLEDGGNVIVRPSGTEPKIKAYITAVGTDRATAQDMADRLLADVGCIFVINHCFL